MAPLYPEVMDIVRQGVGFKVPDEIKYVSKLRSNFQNCKILFPISIFVLELVRVSTQGGGYNRSSSRILVPRAGCEDMRSVTRLFCKHQ